MSAPRTVAAVLSAGLMLALAGWSLGLGQVAGPARVEATAEFRISHTGDGRFRWTLLDGRVPGGPAVVADGVLQGDRGDPVEVERSWELVPGQRVEVGAVVARLRASRLDEEVATLEAEDAQLLAESDLVEAGGRPEAVARARQAVEVADAALAQARAELEHRESLAEQGAGAAWPVQEARQLLEVRQAERDLAAAALDEAREPPRPEELAALQARRRVIEARLAAARERLDGQVLTSPIAGTVRLAGADTILAIDGDGPSLLHVAVDEADRESVTLGDRVSFAPTAAADAAVSGIVVAVGGTAETLGGQPVVWVVAELEHSLPVGATGRARVLARQGT